MPFGLPGLCIEPGWATEDKFLNDTLDTSNDAKREGPQLEWSQWEPMSNAVS